MAGACFIQCDASPLTGAQDRAAPAVASGVESGVSVLPLESLRAVLTFVSSPSCKTAFKELCASRKTPEVRFLCMAP